MYFWEIHGGGGGIGWNSNLGAEGDTVSLWGSALLFPPPPLQPAHWREFHNISHITYCFCLKEKTQLYKLC